MKSREVGGAGEMAQHFRVLVAFVGGPSSHDQYSQPPESLVLEALMSSAHLPGTRHVGSIKICMQTKIKKSLKIFKECA